MSVDKCVLEIERATGRQLSDEEVNALDDEVGRIVRRLRDEEIDNVEQALDQALAERADEIELLAWVEKRNELLNARARASMLDYVINQWDDDPGLGLLAYTGGVASARQGARESVSWAQETLGNRYAFGFITELEQAGVFREFKSGAFDQEIFRVRYARARGETDAQFSRESRQMADIIERYNEKVRLDANESGAWIGQVDDFVARQVHDAYNIRQTSEREWTEFFEQAIDWRRSFPDVEDAAEIKRIISRSYSDFASGVHLAAPREGPQTNLRGFANIGRRMSQDRVFHFKGPDEAFEYMRRYGRGSLAETLLNQFELSAQNTALMRRMGPNAESNFDQVVDTLRARLRDSDAKTRRRFESLVDTGPRAVRRTILPNLTGQSRRPGHHLTAKASQMTREIASMSKLGGAVISAVSDIPFYAGEFSYTTGQGFLRGVGEAVGSLGTPITPERRRVLAGLGVVVDSMRASAAGRFDVGNRIFTPTTKMQNVFFKLNLLQPWTDRLRSGFALARAHDFYNQRARGFSQLAPEEQRALELYNIDAERWDVFRAQQPVEADGRGYLTPEAVEDASDAQIAQLLRSKGKSTSARAIRDERTAIVSSFRSFFGDRASYASLTPDIRSRAILLQGTRPGTVEGELLRHTALFKGFPTSVMLKPLGREIYGRGTLRGRGAAFDDSPLMNVANMVAWNTAMGYMALNIKEMLRGRTPRVPEDPGEFRDIFMASMVQGGGMGIYGDFLFGDTRNRFGGTFVSSLAGPVAGEVDNLADLWGRTMRGDDAAAQSLRFVYNNLPGSNLFYTRMAMDYAIMYRMQEWLNPGSLRRMEGRMESEMGNDYWMRPSDHIPYGGF